MWTDVECVIRLEQHSLDVGFTRRPLPDCIASIPYLYSAQHLSGAIRTIKTDLVETRPEITALSPSLMSVGNLFLFVTQRLARNFRMGCVNRCPRDRVVGGQALRASRRRTPLSRD
ncbi:hypothetical protein NPIL_578191 [Nephila pilipes]|uniref:Uncharacterized protein n=1 Tax=Nephila pilipes TaxID=299642 RepID=A0A8X6P6D5_NEPPI|nr:hypothetical protein NPIL_578191 [Nephila pilipes]